MAKSKSANSTIELTFQDPQTANVVYRAIKPEEFTESRCEVEISRRKNVLSFEINATDTAALRAAINSFLRWAAVARDMTKV